MIRAHAKKVPPRQPEPVTRREFLDDPAAIVRRAEREGPIAIVDEHGVARMVISAPRDRRPVIDE